MDNTTHEFFIRRAWNCNRFKKGANTDTWEDLRYKEHSYKEAIGISNEKKTKQKYDSKFDEVKTYIDNAYENLLKKAAKVKNNKTLIGSLLSLKTQANQSTTSQEMFDVLRESFNIINEYEL